MKELIEAQIAIMEPSVEAVDKYCSSIRAIYENKYIVREFPCEDWIVEKVSKLIVDAIVERKRFRQLDCLKVLKLILKGNLNCSLSKNTMSHLFVLYKKYVFHEKEEYQWCVSSYLLGRTLEEEQISWLTSNWRESTHIVNRLLRYPFENNKVTQWARQRYADKELPERRSELIAKFISKEFKILIKEEPTSSLCWAICYSLEDIEIKVELLNKIALRYNEYELIKVCGRLGTVDPLKALLRKHYA